MPAVSDGGDQYFAEILIVEDALHFRICRERRGGGNHSVSESDREKSPAWASRLKIQNGGGSRLVFVGKQDRSCAAVRCCDNPHFRSRLESVG